MRKFVPLKENAAGSPGTLVQLASSSTSTLPIGHTRWWRPFRAVRTVNYGYNSSTPSDNNNNLTFSGALPWILSAIVAYKYLLKK